jgi:hypothetical protein
MQAMVSARENVVCPSLLPTRRLPSMGALLALSGWLLIWTVMTESEPVLDSPVRKSAQPPTRNRLGSAGDIRAAEWRPGAKTACRCGRRTRSVRECQGEPPVLYWACVVTGAIGERPVTRQLARSGAAFDRSEPKVARGTRAESPVLAARLLRSDPREALLEIAAAQHRGNRVASCPCPLLGLGAHGTGQSNNDDRIAIALFGPR